MTKLKPTVITLHDPFFLSGHCIHHFNCEKWKTHCTDCEFLNIPFSITYDDTALKYFLKKILINNSFISPIVASDWMYNLLKQSPIWKSKNIYKLPFGINQNIFKPYNSSEAKKKLGIDDNSITLMLRSQDNPFKGIDIIRYTLNNLQSNKKITLITVGQRGLLNTFREKYIIKEFEWVTDDFFLAQLYQASDILLMPSSQEAFGLMAAEAMSCGKMVLATKNTALEFTINHPHCGIAIQYDAESYTKELQRLLNNENEIKLRGNQCYEFALANYSYDIFFSGLINIYKDVEKKYINYIFDSEKEIIELVISQLETYSIEDRATSKDSTNKKNKFSKCILRKLKKIHQKLLMHIQ